MNNELDKLLEIYTDTEEKILTILSELKNSGKKCDCKSPQEITFVHYDGKIIGTISLCLDCGGFYEE